MQSRAEVREVQVRGQPNAFARNLHTLGDSAKSEMLEESRQPWADEDTVQQSVMAEGRASQLASDHRGRRSP